MLPSPGLTGGLWGARILGLSSLPRGPAPLPFQPACLTLRRLSPYLLREYNKGLLRSLFSLE